MQVEVTFEVMCLCAMYFVYGLAAAFIGMWVWKSSEEGKRKKRK